MPALRTLFVLLLCGSLVPAAELRTLSGKSITGELVGLNGKEVVIRGEGGSPVATPLTDVMALELQPAAALPANVKVTLVALTDGSVLYCSQLRPKGKQAELTLASAEDPARNPLVLTVPLAAVSYFFNDAQDPAVRQEWQEKVYPARNNTLIHMTRVPIPMPKPSGKRKARMASQVSITMNSTAMYQM